MLRHKYMICGKELEWEWNVLVLDSLLNTKVQKDWAETI